MFMKTLTTIILRRFGFRKVLTLNALVAIRRNRRIRPVYSRDGRTS